MGYILWVEAGFLLLPALTACVCGEVYWRQFLLTAALCAAVGTGLPPGRCQPGMKRLCLDSAAARWARCSWASSPFRSR